MPSLEYKPKLDWPKLAWVAVLTPGHKDVEVYHGPMVETRDNWSVEGVWNGKFENGDFAKTDLIFGSGLYQTKNQLIFVSSATGVDRLWYVKNSTNIVVSNSLPGLLKIADFSLKEDYSSYYSDLKTVQSKGIYSCTKKIPSNGADIQFTYYKNLIWDYENLFETEKPSCAPSFSDYKSYESYLIKSATLLGENARSSSRSFPIDMLVGLSSGFDSIATAVVSRYAGCRKSASITNSSSLWRGSDSGKHIADVLNMKCDLYRQHKRKYKNELAVWASSGGPGGRNFTLFNYPKPLCLFFSGGYGDAVWDIHAPPVEEPKGGFNELLCEFRLIEGIFFCVVPWWGIKKVQEIQSITHHSEMKPWTLGTDYDRPIARRLIEEAGIPRGSYASRKKDTASNSPLFWPSSKEASKSLTDYLRLHNLPSPSAINVKLYSILSGILNFIYNNTFKRYGIKTFWKPWRKFPGRQHIFIWANHTLRDSYYK